MFNPASIITTPIIGLSPFAQKQWVKARVTDKGEIRSWNKPSSSGKLFSCTLVDETGAIRATFFNDAVDACFPSINNGQVFYFGNGTVKPANRRFNNVNNEYEISFDRDIQLNLARDAATSIPQQRFNFVPINVCEHKEKWSPVDILCVVLKVSDASKIVAKKTQKEMLKRVITIGDTTGTIDITAWEDLAQQWSHPVGTVLAIKSATVNLWDGVSLSFGKDTNVVEHPQVPEVKALQMWYHNTGGAGVKSLTVAGKGSGQGSFGENSNNLGRKHLTSIDSQHLGRGEKSDYIDVMCTPVHIKSDAVWYDACPDCNKKVNPINDSYRCEKCDKMIQHPMPRYLSSIQVSDGVTTKWFTLFNEAGEIFWRMPALELKRLAAKDASIINFTATSRLHTPMMFSLRLSLDKGFTGADGQSSEDRVRCTVVRIKDSGSGCYREETHNHLKQIALYHE